MKRRPERCGGALAEGIMWRMQGAFAAVVGLSACMLWAPARVCAEAAADAAPSALSERDGSVRAEGGLRLSVQHTDRSAAGDHAVAIAGRVQAQMQRVRDCHQVAAHRDARLEGRVIVRLSHVTRSHRKVTVERNDTGDGAFERCVSRSLARVRLRGLPLGAAATVEVAVSAPGASLRGEMRRRAAQAQHVDVQRDASGHVQSEGRTQGGEVQFSLSADGQGRDTLVALHQSVSERLAGLLDCRRRASHRGIAPEGAWVFDVTVLPRSAGSIKTVRKPARDRHASECMEEWLKRGDPAGLPLGRVQLTLRYGP